MRQLDLFRSGALRFALLLAVVFAAGAGGLLVIMQHSVASYAAEAAVGSLQTEVAILAAEDRAGGRRELLAAIDRHQRVGGDQVFRYLLADPSGRRIAGTLPIMEAETTLRTIAVPGGDVGEAGGAELDSLRALGKVLGDGSTLVVATDTYDIIDLQSRLGRFTTAFGAMAASMPVMTVRRFMTCQVPKFEAVYCPCKAAHKSALLGAPCLAAPHKGTGCHGDL